MGELRMHAMGITEVRDMFAASPDLAATLRQLAGEKFRVPAPDRPEKGLLSKLGPLLKRTPATSPVFPDGMPLPSDWETLIAGRYVPPERTDLSWLVVDTWLDALDWGTLTREMTGSQVEQFDFALTKAGLPSQFSLGKLMADDAQLGLRPGTGMRVGYSKHGHVVATLAELRMIIAEVDAEHSEPAHALLDYLAAFETWSHQAQQAGRPEPDLVVIWWESGRG